MGNSAGIASKRSEDIEVLPDSAQKSYLEFGLQKILPRKGSSVISKSFDKSINSADLNLNEQKYSDESSLPPLSPSMPSSLTLHEIVQKTEAKESSANKIKLEIELPSPKQLSSSTSSRNNTEVGENMIPRAKLEFNRGNKEFNRSNIVNAEACYIYAISLLAANSGFSLCDTPSNMTEEAQRGLFNQYYRLTCKESPHADKTEKGSTEEIEEIVSFADERAQTAKRLLQQAADANRACFTDISSLDMLFCYCDRQRDRGCCLFTTGMAESIEHIRQHGALDDTLADALNNLAACHEKTGRIASAKLLYQKSLALRQVVHGKHSLKAAESMQNLGTVLDAEGQSSDAETLLSDSLAIELELLGENSVQAAVSMNNLGVLCAHLGRFERAHHLFEKSLSVRRAVYGDEHCLTISVQNNLNFARKKLLCLMSGEDGTERSSSL